MLIPGMAKDGGTGKNLERSKSVLHVLEEQRDFSRKSLPAFRSLSRATDGDCLVISAHGVPTIRIVG